MKVTVKGQVLEKFTKDVTTQAGTKEQRMFVRLYQEGERMNLDVNVKVDTYSAVQVGQTIELDDIKISTFKDTLYARQ